MHEPANIEQWVFSRQFKLNVYRFANPKDESPDPKPLTFVILAPGDNFPENHPIIEEMGFSHQANGRGNFMHNLGYDPDDSRLRRFVNDMLSRNYDGVEATPFIREAAYIMDNPDLRLRVIADQQTADVQSDRYLRSDRPFIMVINPNEAGAAIGIVMPELSEEDARQIDPNTFPYQGGMFIHAQHIQRSDNFIPPSPHNILVVNEQIMDHQIITAVQKGTHIYYGGILYSPRNVTENSGENAFVQSYLDEQGRYSDKVLLDKMRILSGYIPRSAQGMDNSDYLLEQMRIAENLHTNERIRSNSGQNINAGTFIRQKLIHFGFGRDVQAFFSAIDDDTDQAQGIFAEQHQNNGPVSELLIDDNLARDIHQAARENAGKTADTRAFPTPQNLFETDIDSVAVLRVQALNEMERLRRIDTLDRQNAILHPIYMKTLRNLIETNLLGSEIETRAVLSNITRSDMALNLRRAQNDILYLYGEKEEALNIKEVVLAAMHRIAQGTGKYQPAVMDYALSLKDSEQSLSAVDSIARRMLYSSVNAHQVTAQNYFVERQKIFQDADGLAATDERSVRLQQLFHTYFSQESPIRQGLPTETFLFKKLHSRAFRETGNFADVLEKFADQHGQEIAQIQARIAAEVEAGLRNPTDGEPIREQVGDGAFFDYHGVALETYETRQRADQTVEAQNAYPGRYLFVDDYEFMSLLVQMDKERREFNRYAAPEDRISNYAYHNISPANYGEGNINQSKIFVREEALHLVPTDLIRRQRALHEKYIQNRDRDYSGIADHVFVKKGNTQHQGKILRGFSRATISECTPTARYDNNDINRAGYVGKGTFVETRFLWMLEKNMLHDMLIAERREQARQRRQQQQEGLFKEVTQAINFEQRVYLGAMRNMFDMQVDQLREGELAERYLLNPDFVQAFPQALRMADEQNILSPAERIAIFQYFSDAHLAHKLAVLQNDLPQVFLYLHGHNPEKMASEMARPAFLHMVGSHIMRHANDPLPDNPFQFAREQNTQNPEQIIAAIRATHQALLESATEMNGTLDATNALPAALIETYRAVGERIVAEMAERDSEFGKMFTHRLLLDPHTLLDSLREFGNSDNPEQAIYDRLASADVPRVMADNAGTGQADAAANTTARPGAANTTAPIASAAEVTYRESWQLTQSREQFERAERRFAANEEDESRQADLNDARDVYAVALINEIQRLANAYGNIENRGELQATYEEALAAIRADVSVDAEIRIDNLTLARQSEPDPQEDLVEFARFHGLREGFYRKRDGGQISGYYFDLHDKEFRSALTDFTHPDNQHYTRKVFANVWGDAVDEEQNANRAFVRSEELGLLPLGVIRENGRLLAESNERRANRLLAGTEDNPDVAAERLLADEPSRENPSDIYDHYGIEASFYRTRNNKMIPGRYLEVHDETFRNAVNQLGSRENRIFGTHVFTQIEADNHPDGETRLGMVFVRESALDKIPAAVIREHARLQQLRAAADYDEFTHLPRHTHVFQNGKEYSGYFIPNFSLEEVRAALPGTIAELVSGELDENQDRNALVQKHKVWPMPLVHADAMPYLPDAMTVDNAMTADFANTLILRAKGNETRVRMIVDAYNSVTRQENQKINHSIEDLVILSRAEYEFEKNERRRERRQQARAERIEAQRANEEPSETATAMEILAAIRGGQSADEGQSVAVLGQDGQWEVFGDPELRDANPVLVPDPQLRAGHNLIQEYLYSEDFDLMIIAQDYSAGREAWLAADLDEAEFDAFFDHSDAQTRIHAVYNQGLFANIEALSAYIREHIPVEEASVDAPDDDMAAITSSDDDAGFALSGDTEPENDTPDALMDLVAANAQEPEAATLEALLAPSVLSYDNRTWIEAQVHEQNSPTTQWEVLQNIGQLFAQAQRQHLDSSDDEILTKVRKSITAPDVVGREASVSDIGVREVMSLAWLAKDRINNPRPDNDWNAYEVEQLAAFRGWQHVREVQSGDIDTLTNALLDNAHLSLTYTPEDARSMALSLIEQAREGYPAAQEHGQVLWPALQQAGVEVSFVADLQSQQGALLQHAPHTVQGDAYVPDHITALFIKGRGELAHYVLPMDSLAQAVPKDHYDVMMVALAGGQGQKRPVVEAGSGIAFANSNSARLHQLNGLKNGGVAVILADNNFANSKAPPLQQQLAALNLLAEQFTVIGAVHGHEKDSGQMILLQKTASTPYARSEGEDLFAPGMRMRSDIMAKMQQADEAWQQHDNPDTTVLGKILADQIRANQTEVGRQETRSAQDDVLAQWQSDLRQVPADALQHAPDLAPGSLAMDGDGQLVAVVSVHEHEGERHYSVQSLNDQPPLSVREAYFALRDTLLVTPGDPQAVTTAQAALLETISSQTLDSENARYALRTLQGDLHFQRTLAVTPWRESADNAVMDVAAAVQSLPVEGMPLTDFVARTGQDEQTLHDTPSVYVMPAQSTWQAERVYSRAWVNANVAQQVRYTLLSPPSAAHDVLTRAWQAQAAHFAMDWQLPPTREVDPHIVNGFVNRYLNRNEAIQLDFDVRYPQHGLSWKILSGNTAKDALLAELSPTQQGNAIAHILNGTHYSSLSTGKLDNAEFLEKVNNRIHHHQENLRAWLYQNGVGHERGAALSGVKTLLQQPSLVTGGVVNEEDHLRQMIATWAQQRSTREGPLLLVVEDVHQPWLHALQRDNPALTIQTVANHSEGAQQRLNARLLHDTQADIVILPSSQLDAMPSATLDKSFSLVPKNVLAQRDVEALKNEEITMSALPGSSVTGLPQKHVARYLDNLQTMRIGSSRFLQDTADMPPLPFSHIVVADQHMVASPDGLRMATVQAMIGQQAGSTLTVWQQNTGGDQSSLYWQVMQTNHPQLIYRAGLRDSADMRNVLPVVGAQASQQEQFAVRDKPTQPGYQQWMAKTGHDLGRWHGNAGTINLAQAALWDKDAPDGRAADLVAQTTHLPLNQMVVVALLGNADQPLADQVLAQAEKAGISVLQADGRNPAELQKALNKHDPKLLLVTAEDLKQRHDLSHRVGMQLVASLPSLDKYHQYMQALQNMDAYCRLREVWVAQDTLEASKQQLLNLAAQNPNVRLPSDRELAQSPYLSALLHGHADGVEAAFARLAMPALQREGYSQEQTLKAMRSVQTQAEKLEKIILQADCDQRPVEGGIAVHEALTLRISSLQSAGRHLQNQISQTHAELAFWQDRLAGAEKVLLEQGFCEPLNGQGQNGGLMPTRKQIQRFTKMPEDMADAAQMAQEESQPARKRQMAPGSGT